VPNVSQGTAATYLKCGGIFSDVFIVNLLPNLKKNFESRSAFGTVNNKNQVALLFRCMVDNGPNFFVRSSMQNNIKTRAVKLLMF